MRSTKNALQPNGRNPTRQFMAGGLAPPPHLPASSLVRARRSDYTQTMTPENGPRRAKRMPPPGETGEEALYLRFLSEKRIAVVVKLRDGESVSGWIEYFDDTMIRLTREGKPNLFIYKHQIRTIREQARRSGNRTRSDGDEGSAN